MKKKILAVAIKGEIVAALNKELEADNYYAISVDSASRAFSFINKNVSFVIISDALPEGESFKEFCLSVRSNNATAGIPVILFVESQGSAYAKIEALKNGLINDYINFPTAIEEVVARIKIFLQVMVLQEELEMKNILLNKLSITDELTKLYNRRYLLVRLGEEIERIKRYDYSVSCMMIDLDHFKRVNDKFGHGAGDQVLVECAKLLKNSIRVTDILSRYGGEEFFIILPHASLAGAKILAERLRSIAMSYTFLESKENLKLTLSIGVTSFSAADKADQNKVIEVADAQLYLAKRKGRNRVEAVAYLDYKPEDK